jgi:hypothetical protein
MVLIDGHDLTVYYIAETSYGVVADDGTWSPLLELMGFSGHGFSQEVKDIRRHGKRTRVGSPGGKIDNPDLSFEVNLTTDALDAYEVFLSGSFKSTYDTSTPTYAFGVSNNSAFTGGTYFEYYYGCVLSTVELSFSEGEVITATFNFSVQTSVFSATELHAPVSATYTAYPATITYALWSDISAFAKSGGFATDDDLYALKNVNELSISIDQNVEKLWRLDGQAYPAKVHLSGFDVTGSFTIDHEGITQVAEAIAKSVGGLAITLSSVGTITLTDVTYDETTFDTEPNALVTMDISFTASDITFA